jgi:hypothetical protein
MFQFGDQPAVAPSLLVSRLKIAAARVSISIVESVGDAERTRKALELGWVNDIRMNLAGGCYAFVLSSRGLGGLDRDCPHDLDVAIALQALENFGQVDGPSANSKRQFQIRRASIIAHRDQRF